MSEGSTIQRSPAACALDDSPLAGMRAGLDTCVHCGFCLQACPTYLALDDENDSPRGRIVLMRSLLEGETPPQDAALQQHIAQCLGCRGCETACPSGVPYGHLLEATRATLRETSSLPFPARVILAVFAHPRSMRAAMWGARVARATGLPRLLAHLPGQLGFAFAMLASTSRRESTGSRPRRIPRGAGARGSVAVLTGCVMEGLFTDVNRATERVLAENDYALANAPGQRCCGALHAHAGDDDSAKRLARINIAAFERSGADFVCSNAAGCGAMMKDYGHLLRGDPAWSARAAAVSARVRDVSELLAAAGPRPAALRAPVRATYDAPCHLMHAQRVVSQPLQTLGAVSGLELTPLAESDQCCGSAGIYNLIEPDVSNRVLDRKLARLGESGADVVATGNPGCLMQIGAGLLRTGSRMRAMHPVELLDQAYAAGNSRASAPGGGSLDRP